MLTGAPNRVRRAERCGAIVPGISETLWQENGPCPALFRYQGLNVARRVREVFAIGAFRVVLRRGAGLGAVNKCFTGPGNCFVLRGIGPGRRRGGESPGFRAAG